MLFYHTKWSYFIFITFLSHIHIHFFQRIFYSFAWIVFNLRIVNSLFSLFQVYFLIKKSCDHKTRQNEKKTISMHLYIEQHKEIIGSTYFHNKLQHDFMMEILTTFTNFYNRSAWMWDPCTCNSMRHAFISAYSYLFFLFRFSFQTRDLKDFRFLHDQFCSSRRQHKTYHIVCFISVLRNCVTWIFKRISFENVILK